MVSQEAQFMAGAFLVVVAAAAADVCRWYAAPYSITLVSVKVASDFGVVFGQVCICRLCQNPTNAVKSAAVLNRLDYFLRTYFGHFRLINWWHWHGPQKAQQRGKETLLLQKLFFIIISVICLIYKKFHKR